MSVFEIADKNKNILATAASLSSSQNDGTIQLKLINNFDVSIEFPFYFTRIDNKDNHYPGLQVNVMYIAQSGNIRDYIFIEKYSRQ